MDLDVRFRECCAFLQEKGESLRLSDEQKLMFYGYYKQATDGPCSTPAPSFWDFRGFLLLSRTFIHSRIHSHCIYAFISGKAKWNAWNVLGPMTKEEAMRKYISLLSSLTSSPVPSSSSSSSHSGMGPVFSRFVFDEEDAPATHKETPSSLARNGEVEKLLSLLHASPHLLHQPLGAKGEGEEEGKEEGEGEGEEGMTLLHIAADAGREEVVRALLKEGAKVNERDKSGQTPLYIAALMNEKGIVTLLLENGADPNIPDLEGELPVQAATDADIRSLLGK